ncbi:hypothetical protein TRIP_B200082 [uncultured Desulfatiglans sp.]|uniref:Uncharacterized protein n=1 Tax=Uncultured Desulfatiglans sp. TaxID=1748965 RepID=A0A653A2R1_UNCDX|nr:hypothetical protein TRIP_B200082 [uncultured Desulfatiglans sp.]
MVRNRIPVGVGGRGATPPPTRFGRLGGGCVRSRLERVVRPVPSFSRVQPASLLLDLVQSICECPADHGKAFHVEIAFGPPFEEERALSGEILVTVVEKHQEGDLGESVESQGDIARYPDVDRASGETSRCAFEFREAAGEQGGDRVFGIGPETAYKRGGVLEILIGDPFRADRFFLWAKQEILAEDHTDKVAWSMTEGVGDAFGRDAVNASKKGNADNAFRSVNAEPLFGLFEIHGRDAGQVRAIDLVENIGFCHECVSSLNGGVNSCEPCHPNVCNTQGRS